MTETKKPGAADWSFLRRPFWIFSHLFALTVIVSFVLLGFWQLSRYHQRVDHNTVIASRTAPPAVDLRTALGSLPAEQLDYQLVSGQGRYVADDVVRVANRSQGGVAGEYLVSVFQLDDGREILVNRGFVPLDQDVPVLPAPTGEVTVEGWLRASVNRERFGATDTGQGAVVPRLDVAAIQERLDGETLEPVWLQLSPSGPKAAEATFPDPVPLPELTKGPHLSYMGQWWIFATLGLAFYLALLRRTARRGAAPLAPLDATDSPEPHQPKLGV